MKKYRADFFRQMAKHRLSQNEDVYLYFLRGNQVEQVVLTVEEGETPRILVKANKNLEALRKQINKNEIVENLSPKYRLSWEEGWDNLDLNKISLNSAARYILGPALNPRRKSHYYNVYTTFFCALDEIAEIIDPNLIRRFGKVTAKGRIFYTFEEAAKAAIANDEISPKFAAKNLFTDDFAETELSIERLKISNFINFQPLDLKFSPTINLFIGKNNTGKTSLLKLMYGAVKSLEDFIKQKKLYDRSFQSVLSQKMQEIFQSSEQGIGTIVSKDTQQTLNATLEFSYLQERGEAIAFSVEPSAKKEIQEVELSDLLGDETGESFNAIFVPAKEILSISEAIRTTFRSFVKGFDATYNDLTELIMPFIEKEGISPEFRAIAECVQTGIMGGEIIYDPTLKEFVYRNQAGQRFEMTMTAEGIKQLGIIPILINTGKLQAGSILFLDEPDNNLNPVTINTFVQTLVELSQLGVQIFLTSHNNFIVKRLQIYAKKLPELDFKIFSMLDNTSDGKIGVEANSLKDGLPQYNPILDETLNMFDDELKVDFGYE